MISMFTREFLLRSIFHHVTFTSNNGLDPRCVCLSHKTEHTKHVAQIRER